MEVAWSGGGVAPGCSRRLWMGRLPIWGRGRCGWRMQRPALVEGAQGYLASGKAEQMVEAAHGLGFSSVQCA